MPERPSYPSLKQRTIVLLVNLAIFYIAFAVASGKLVPTGGLESVWLLSAAALWLLNLLSAPWFLPPRDSLANGIAAGSVLAALELSGIAEFQRELNIIRWIGVAYAVFVILLSLGSLFLHDRTSPTAIGRFTYRAVGIFGKAEISYSIAAIISIVGAYQGDFAAMASLLLIWVFFVVAEPVERMTSAFQAWKSERATLIDQATVGTIDRIDHPNILRVKLETGQRWQQGRLYAAAMPDGEQQYVAALFAQPQGTEVIGTGLCVATISEPLPLASGKVVLSHNEDLAAEFIEKLSGAKDAKLVGFVVENSTIGVVNFEIAAASVLQEGEVIFVRIDGKEVFYQILDAVTSEENFDNNPRGTHIVRAGQLGYYEYSKGFLKYPWLPAMNTPVFAAKERKFEQPVLGEREFPIGIVPSTDISLTANLDELVEYHTAILGVTGTGKTELALDIVREAVVRGTKPGLFTGDQFEAGGRGLSGWNRV